MPNVVCKLVVRGDVLLYCVVMFILAVLWLLCYLLWLRHVFEVNEGLSSYMR